MHSTALLIGREFFRRYLGKGHRRILDIGAYDMNGSLRREAPAGCFYIGMDMEAGPGVDVVNAAGGALPLADGSIDVALCSSVFEHDSAFWSTFLEMARVVRPGGYIYVNAPSNGWYHLHPDDCWRFYPDAGVALAAWSRRSGLDVTLIESFVADQFGDIWNDFVAVFVRGPANRSPRVFLHQRFPSFNVRQIGEPERLRVRHESQDMLDVRLLRDDRARLLAEVERLGVEVSRLQTEVDSHRAAASPLEPSPSANSPSDEPETAPPRRRTGRRAAPSTA